MESKGLVDLVNTLFEGLISLTVIVGGGLLASSQSGNTAVMTLVSGGTGIVLTFWFSQRGQQKTANGQTTALAALAAQIAAVKVDGSTVAASPIPTQQGGQK